MSSRRIGERGSEDGGGPAHACWYAEDQLGSRIGATDANGYKEMEVDYLEYGEPLLRKIALHIPANAISSTSYDSGVLVTRINLNANAPAFNTGDFVGMQLAISKTGVAEGYRMGNVVETSASPRYIKVYDPESNAANRISGLITPGSGSGLSIIDAPLVGDATSPRLAGGWTSNPGYTGSADNTTIFTSETSPFGDCMEGWYLVPDVRRPVALRIVWAYQGQVAVSGNATTMADINSRFMIYPPPGIDPLTCKVAFDGNDCVTYLFAGYRYMPSVGGALSTTASGTYYCWNRVYDPVIGRWTSPDPAQSPVWNLMDYCGNRPVQGRDARGLELIDPRGGIITRGMFKKVDKPKTEGVVAEIHYRIVLAEGWIKYENYYTESSRDCKGYEEYRDEASGASCVISPPNTWEVSCRYDKYDLVVRVDTDKSWTSEKNMSAELLAHEQGHYDIANAFATAYSNWALFLIEKGRGCSKKEAERDCARRLEQRRTEKDESGKAMLDRMLEMERATQKEYDDDVYARTGIYSQDIQDMWLRVIDKLKKAQDAKILFPSELNATCSAKKKEEQDKRK